MQPSQNNPSPLHSAPLGKSTDYAEQYDPSLLYPVPRQMNRDELKIVEGEPLPFYGEDIWHGYELSWLNGKGKPVVALARFRFACDTPNIVESKSFKLYLNSFNQTRFDSHSDVADALTKDLGATAGGDVAVELFGPDELSLFTPTKLPGECIDDLDIEIDNYQLDPVLLRSAGDNPHVVEETLHSHLLKSNCLITSQPDWASVQIQYKGAKINREALLRYLVSFRQHNEFHEQCVERLYCDLQQYLKPERLTVTAFYTRRGGLDINPTRSSEKSATVSGRINRQ